MNTTVHINPTVKRLLTYPCKADGGTILLLRAQVEMRCDKPQPTKNNRAAAGHSGAGISAYDELQSVHQLPRKPCHYVFALASPDACQTQHSGSGVRDAVELPPIMPLAPLNETGAFGQKLVQADPQQKRPERDPAKVAAQRRAAEEAHRASMEEARKQQLLDMQMQRQLEQLQKQRAQRLLEKATTSRELGNKMEPLQAPTASKLQAVAVGKSKDINGEEAKGKETRHDMSQLSHGVLSGFGSPSATPEGVLPHGNGDREL
eukprot:COSAG02_NODE_2838_length_7918_cov_103.655710_6_plen_262_part_00